VRLLLVSTISLLLVVVRVGQTVVAVVVLADI
jgi:hypothetical protein